jgi:hypothetical protein
MPVVDMSDPYAWQTHQEANLFSTVRRMELAGASTERIDQYYDTRVAELESDWEDIKWAAEIDLPWWERLRRFIVNSITRVQFYFFPPDGSSGDFVITNPVGGIPVIGQLFGFGMELGKITSGRRNVIIENQYGNIPIVTPILEGIGWVFDHYKLFLILGVVCIAFFVGGKIIGIVKIFI